MRLPWPWAGVVAVVVLGGSSSAVATDHDEGVVLSGALGRGFGGGDYPVAGELSISVWRNAWTIGLRRTEIYEFNILGPTPDESNLELAVLAGRRAWGRAHVVTAATGLALVRTVRRGEAVESCSSRFLGGCQYEARRRYTIGFPLEADLVLAARPVGVGITVFGNVNSVSSFGGVLLRLDLGRLR